jgi:hypothetical protein
MDELLIKYCKENGYIYVDISHKFVDYNFESIDYLNNTLEKLLNDDKYYKMVLKINFEKINQKYHKLFKNLLNDNDISKRSLLINTNRQSSYKNDIKLNEFNINQFFNREERTCCICLERFKNSNISCLICSAKYHKTCLINPNYSYRDDNGCILCAICKSNF